jgi:hypothetical protein
MTSFISSPTELLKIRMQLQKPLPGTPGYLGPWGTLQQVVRQEGVHGERLGGVRAGGRGEGQGLHAVMGYVAAYC